MTFDIAYSSVLKRAIRTQHLLAEAADLVWVPEIHHWRLNERHYGALQGLNKAETAKKYGAEQVHIWRRSFDVTPPLLEPDDPRNAVFENKYKDVDPAALPLGESLSLTINRVLPFWQDYIAPALLSDKTVLITAHGNSLRALVKYLNNISDEDIVEVGNTDRYSSIVRIRRSTHACSSRLFKIKNLDSVFLLQQKNVDLSVLTE